VGSEQVLEVPASSPYSHDWGRRRGVESRAELAVLPGNAEEVAAVVAWCYEHDVPIVPRGGGTGMMGGAVATHGGIVLSLERLRRIRELEPGLWRIMPEAGVTTRDVQRLARENGLMFAPDPGAAEQSQIGGNVATIGQILGSGMRPAVLDFLDGQTLRMLGGSYPGFERLRGAAGATAPEGTGFALIVELDGSAADVRAQRSELLELLGSQAVAIDQPLEAAELWRWRDGDQRASSQVCAGRRSARTWCSRSSAWLEGLDGLRRRLRRAT
jgi:FAD/FMN-containing dehydrogenase